MMTNLCKDCIYCTPLVLHDEDNNAWLASDAEATWTCTHSSSKQFQPISPLTGEVSGKPFFRCSAVRGESAEMLANKLNDEPVCTYKGVHFEERD